MEGRIVVGRDSGKITLNQMNYETKEWKVLTQKDKAHDEGVTSLCELSNKRVISSSQDKTIKVWSVLSYNEIKLIKTLTQHKEEVLKVITLTDKRFASCSGDGDNGTVKLYNSETYKQIETPFEQQEFPSSLLQLKRQKEVLVISNYSKPPALHFYQLSPPYKLLGTVNGVWTTPVGLIELSNGHVAASLDNPDCIYIVDPLRYKIIATIENKEYIPYRGALHAFSNNSFIYVSEMYGCLCEISMINGEYKISFKTKENEEDLIGTCICVVNNGKYLISSNEHNGCNIFEYSY